uniref:Uncharacterized protein n=1 Tax=Trichuris muris TaxID=70415 RepID=A0A5S6Q7R4_TRIMR
MARGEDKRSDEGKPNAQGTQYGAFGDLIEALPIKETLMCSLTKAMLFLRTSDQMPLRSRLCCLMDMANDIRKVNRKLAVTTAAGHQLSTDEQFLGRCLVELYTQVCHLFSVQLKVKNSKPTRWGAASPESC